jgi:hypothetical protein
MITLLWELLCVALFWSVFCRSVRVDKTTMLDVRIALWLVGLASLSGLGAPLYGWTPDLVTLIIVGAVVVMQAVMATHWQHGVPYQFIHKQHRPKRRSGDLT